MADRDPAIDHLLELLAPLGAATARRMFGGWGVYLVGEIVVLFARGVAYAKTDALTRAAFEAAGSAPFVFEARGRAVETSYWSLPEAALDSSEALQPWAQLALAAARRKPVARRARGGKSKRG
ncbi:MAG: TfoX/Sxy family protein [Luteimonas sp.]|nr:TfoX/Sxy family protein [Luteimonas sp.]